MGGIVSLPGTVTGQILASLAPLLAMRYPIVVMFVLTAAGVALWYRPTFFTDAIRLRPPR